MGGDHHNIHETVLEGNVFCLKTVLKNFLACSNCYMLSLLDGEKKLHMPEGDEPPILLRDWKAFRDYIIYLTKDTKVDAYIVGGDKLVFSEKERVDRTIIEFPGPYNILHIYQSSKKLSPMTGLSSNDLISICSDEQIVFNGMAFDSGVWSFVSTFGNNVYRFTSNEAADKIKCYDRDGESIMDKSIFSLDTVFNLEFLTCKTKNY